MINYKKCYVTFLQHSKTSHLTHFKLNKRGFPQLFLIQILIPIQSICLLSSLLQAFKLSMKINQSNFPDSDFFTSVFCYSLTYWKSFLKNKRKTAAASSARIYIICCCLYFSLKYCHYKGRNPFLSSRYDSFVPYTR